MPYDAKKSPSLCWLDFNISEYIHNPGSNLYLQRLQLRISDSYTFETPSTECISTAFFTNLLGNIGLIS